MHSRPDAEERRKGTRILVPRIQFRQDWTASRKDRTALGKSGGKRWRRRARDMMEHGTKGTANRRQIPGCVFCLYLGSAPTGIAADNRRKIGNSTVCAVVGEASVSGITCRSSSRLSPLMTRASLLAACPAGEFDFLFGP